MSFQNILEKISELFGKFFKFAICFIYLLFSYFEERVMLDGFFVPRKELVDKDTFDIMILILILTKAWFIYLVVDFIQSLTKFIQQTHLFNQRDFVNRYLEGNDKAND